MAVRSTTLTCAYLVWLARRFPTCTTSCVSRAQLCRVKRSWRARHAISSQPACSPRCILPNIAPTAWHTTHGIPRCTAPWHVAQLQEAEAAATAHKEQMNDLKAQIDRQRNQNAALIKKLKFLDELLQAVCGSGYSQQTLAPCVHARLRVHSSV